MDWREFRTRLARTIRDLDERVFLIVEEEASGVYVQFAAAADTVAAECVANSSTALRRPAGPAGELRLVEIGWTPYSLSNTTWTTSLELPATLDQAGRIADMCITGLREVYEVESPATLTYKAWQDPEPARPRWEYEEADDFGETPALPDPGQDPLLLPDLGLQPT